MIGWFVFVLLLVMVYKYAWKLKEGNLKDTIYLLILTTLLVFYTLLL